MKVPSASHLVSRLFVAVALTALMAGCAPGPRLFVNRDADMTMYKRVVIVPFVNLSGEPYAVGRVVRALTTELIMVDRFQIVDPSLLLGELEQANVTPDATGQFDVNKLRDAAAKLQATAVIRGSVSEYAIRRAGTDEFPVVAFDCEMLDVQTGIVIWRLSIQHSGKGRLPIIGGSGERTFSRVTQEACQSAVTLLRAKIL
ncbi:MAG: hypothetical protein IT348_18395 [Candidatus Eisenbacteria bacterium]|nr:hypothetical protein [Candidatus Eisenbacteria bacterium]